MGQKVSPKALRLGVIETWQSRWYANREYSRYLGEDIKIRKYLKEKLQSAGIAKIEVERAASKVKINLFSAKPGLVIGKGGKEKDALLTGLRHLVQRDLSLNIIEVRKPDLDARLVAESIAFQLEKRVNFRRALKEGVNRAIRAGAEGVKVSVAGRVNGAEIARTEKYREGRVPLHTLRADIDYALGEAHTTYGVLGIKVWIFRGEKFAPGESMPVEAIQL